MRGGGEPSTGSEIDEIEAGEGEPMVLTQHIEQTEQDEWIIFQSRPRPPSYCTGCSVYRLLTLPMSGLVFGLVSLTYIPYVVDMRHTGVVGVIELVVFNFLVIMLLLSYIHCCVLDPGTVPEDWHEAVSRASETTQSRFPKCRKCGMFKPPRSHYDSVTQRLVLNMDHFCPWVMNTVGFYNRKFFVLFLCYTMLACLWYVGAVVIRLTFFGETLIDVSVGGRGVLRFIAFVVDVALGLTLTCFSGFHIGLVVSNETTIDEGTVPEYNVGWRRNVEQVFGPNPWLWAFPVYGSGPVGDGIQWPKNDVERESSDVEVPTRRLLNNDSSESVV